MSYVAVFGARRYPSAARVHTFIDSLDPQRDTVVSGGADGVDSFAELRARSIGVPVISFRPMRVEYNGKAGFAIQRVEYMQRDWWDHGLLATSSVRLLDILRWPTFAKTCFERNRMIVLHCDYAAAFPVSPPTRGTSLTLGICEQEHRRIVFP